VLFNQEGEMVKKIGKIFIGSLVAIFFSWGWVHAQHQHGHETQRATSSKKPASPEQSTSKSVQNITIEGLKISLDVMRMEEHMKHMKTSQGHGEGDHSKTHSFMVTLQDTASKEIISDAKVQYTLSSPTGGKQAGKLVWSGDHYGGSFSPKEKGAYQVQLIIESGGMEREAKFQYEAK
jgi:hypothetical protein